jgi:tricarballylate dehydrogenase
MSPDVVVVGAGNAALSAAIAASDAGARVLVLEKAPAALRGGNTRFTGGLFRIALKDLADVRRLVPELSDAEVESVRMERYDESAYAADVMRLSAGWSDPVLVEALVSQSFDAACWLRDLGVRFRLYPKWMEQDGKKYWPDHAMLSTVDGGQGLSAALFGAAEERGIEVRYEAGVHGLVLDEDGRVSGVRFSAGGREHTVGSGAVVLGSGGFEASPELRARYLGAPWDLARVRGTAYNTGEALAAALAVGAQSAGHWSGAHAVPVDAFAPDLGDLAIGAAASRTSYMFGIMVNRLGRRFVDEGSGFKLFTYAQTGREILGQPGGIAYQIFDQQVLDLVYGLTPGYLRELDVAPVRSGSGRAAGLTASLTANPVTADSIEKLAVKLGIDAGALTQTVAEYNAAVGDAPFDPTRLDGRAARGIDPPKSNWSLALSQPPYVAYAVTCGITFTYGGLKVDAEARVLDRSARPIPGLFATGEVAGGFFFHNYPAGAGLMRGAVFGRIAGTLAAQSAVSPVAA